MAQAIPVVDYLELEPTPRLVAHECTSCGARYFDHRIACAACEGDTFRRVPIPERGILRSFTIVSLAAPGIPVPFVAAVVDCGGTSVRANLVEVEPDPAVISLGMEVELTTAPIGVDTRGVEAICFGFRPVAGGRTP